MPGMSLGLSPGLSRRGSGAFDPVAAGAVFDFDFVNETYWQGGDFTADQVLTTSRASPTTAYAPNEAGLYLPFAANEPRIVPGRGLLTELAKTNVCLWNRDLTNAVWNINHPGANLTVVKDQTGVDGVANAASRLTALVELAQITQPVTLASSARMQSAFMKRLSGSGPIYMAMGGAFTEVTVTDEWTRVTIPTETRTDPVIGIGIGVIGDSIAVDFVQNENDGLNSSTPIYTEGAAVTRNIDWVRLTDDSEVLLSAGTMWVEYEELIAPNSILGWIFNIRIDGNNAIRTGRGTTHRLFFTGDRTSGGSTNFQLNPANTVAAGNIYRAACAWQSNDVAAAWQASLEPHVETDTVFTPAAGVIDVHFGSNGAGTEGGNALNGFIRRVAYAPERRRDGDLIAFARA